MCLYQTLNKFYRDKRGSVSIMGGMIVPVLATAVMASVEFNGVVAAKNTIQRSADTAALFAATKDDLHEQGAAQDLQATTHARIIESVRESGLEVENVVTTYTYDATRDRILGQVTFSPKAKFLGSYFLPETVTVVTEAAPLKPQEVEISLVLDLSGSMNWSPNSDLEEEAEVGSRRIDALRAGVNTLIDELDGEVNVNAKYAIVPYATSVDLTNLAAHAPFGMNAFYENAAGGALPELCAREDFDGDVPEECLGTGNNNTQDPLGSSQTGLWAAERYVANNDGEFTLSLNPPTSNKVPVVTQGNRFDACDPSYVESFGSFCVEAAQNIHGDYTLEKNYFRTRDGILGLTGSAQAARDYLDDLEADGGTAGHLGTIWGLYALTPSWSSVFQHPLGPPKAFDDAESHKIMIVMTDGDFTSTQDPDLSNEDAYAYFQAACEKARENGVEIFTVGFRSSPNTDTQLTDCAGTSSRYYSVNNREALIRAFERISDSATQVRLSY